MDISRIRHALQESGTVIVYDIAKTRIVVEVSNSSNNATGYNLYRYEYANAKSIIHGSECTLHEGAEEILNTVYAEPTYLIWEGEPNCIAYAKVGNKFHITCSCPKCPTEAVEWLMTPRDFSINVDLWCKLCAREVHASTRGKWLSINWNNL
jgi:hypothetical protein